MLNAMEFTIAIIFIAFLLGNYVYNKSANEKY